MEIKEQIKNFKKPMIDDLIGWIKAKGVYDEKTISKDAPFGKDVKESLDYIYNLAKSYGFEATNYDGYCVEVCYGKGHEYVGVLAHADVVPEGDHSEWKYDPFEGHFEEENNCLYGRGSSDDKGPGIVALYALKMIKENNIPLKHSIKLIFGGNEERGSACMHHYFHVLNKQQPKYGFTPDAEFPLIYGEKGIYTYEFSGECKDDVIESLDAGIVSNAVIGTCDIKLNKIYDLENEFNEFIKKNGIDGSFKNEGNKSVIKVIGRAAHASTPQLGINAFVKAIEFLGMHTDSKFCKDFYKPLHDYNGKGLDIGFETEDFGKLTMNVGIAHINNGKYSIIINIRYPNNANGKELKKLIDSHNPQNGKELSDNEPLFIDPNSKLVTTLMDCYKETTKKYDAKPFTIGGGTYAKEASNTVAFGMDFQRNNGTGDIHTINEKLNVDDLVDGLEIYYNALVRLGNLD